jgi:hypothetical protein
MTISSERARARLFGVTVGCRDCEEAGALVVNGGAAEQRKAPAPKRHLRAVPVQQAAAITGPAAGQCTRPTRRPRRVRRRRRLWELTVGSAAAASGSRADERSPGSWEWHWHGPELRAFWEKKSATLSGLFSFLCREF